MTEAENRKAIEELKAYAAEHPFELDPTGRALRTPPGFNTRKLVVNGIELTASFTYDRITDGRQFDHVSMRGIRIHPLPQEIQTEVLRLFFGDEAAKAQTHPILKMSPSHHYVIIRAPGQSFAA